MIHESFQMQTIPTRILATSQSYIEFRNGVDRLVANGLTTGLEHSKAMLAYTRQNVQRMNKWDKILTLSEESQLRIQGIAHPVILLTIVEAWCGDVAQVLPVMNRIAEASPLVDLQIILRDGHPELMDQFLTNGARAIPKVIILDMETNEVIGTWGPRPSEAQAMIMDMKQIVETMPEVERAGFRQKSSEAMHAWYARDKGQRVQIEFLNTLIPLVRSEAVVG